MYRQRSGVFEREAGTQVPSWRGHIHTLLECHVGTGDGLFLFTGAEHFGEAWLGCAPRFKDFLVLYLRAKLDQQNPCDFPLDQPQAWFFGDTVRSDGQQYETIQ